HVLAPHRRFRARVCGGFALVADLVPVELAGLVGYVLVAVPGDIYATLDENDVLEQRVQAVALADKQQRLFGTVPRVEFEGLQHSVLVDVDVSEAHSGHSWSSRHHGSPPMGSRSSGL